MSVQPILVADYKDIRYQCPLSPDKVTYTISDDTGADIFIPDRGHPFHLGLHAVIAEFTDEGDLQVLVAMTGSHGENLDIQEGKVTFIDDIAFHMEYHDKANAQIYLDSSKTITFGQSANIEVSLPRCADQRTFALIKTQEEWTLYPYPHIQECIYVNGALCERAHPLEPGDIIHFAGYRVKIGSLFFTLYHQNTYQLNEVSLYKSPEAAESRYPYFQRPPRQIHPVPADKVVIPNPPSPPAPDRFGLLITIAPMLAMVLMMALMSMMWRGGLFILVTVGTLSVTVVVTIYRYVTDKKTKREDEAERVAFYENLLNAKRKQIRELVQKQRQALEHTNPDPEECVDIARNFSPRLWERARDHTDFFHIRIGVGDQPHSFSIQYTPQETKEAAKDALSKDAAALAAQYTHIPKLPLGLSLLEAYVGVVGDKKITLPHTLAMLTQLTVLHSYLDMSLLLIYTQEYEEALRPFKWLPHTWLGERQFKGLVRDQTTRDNVLVSIHQVLKQRKSDYEQAGKKEIQYPPLVIVVADLDLIYNHVIMEFLSKDHRHLGVYAIFLSESEYALPESATTLLRVVSSEEATLYREKDPTPRPYIPDSLTAVQVSQAARSLAAIQHLMSSSDETIPKSVTLFNMLQVKTPEELDIRGKWRNNKPYKTLSVPLGLRSANNILELNLHEQDHGPHGLLAGTTGSGKSEILQTYILSLAIHFHPHEVAFLLIDYKGGGMANLFDDLPHLLGTITNLDGAQAMRALIAIKSELRRRQAVLGRYEVNHVDAYQKLCADNPALEPMPHLFIISDEFAELKREQPEFISELVSAARIGRSLGVHLILATQKPSGVVDDQIWSNSNFRICLKVQNASDSNEMLKTPDAADIKLPGRGYLQVGNNEIYELFQSAYSGAEYIANKTKTQEKPNDKIYMWTDLGQFRLMIKDFSTLHVRETAEPANPVTELDVTVKAIADAFTAAGLAKVPSPWLPPLPENLCLSDLLHNPSLRPAWADTPYDTTAPAEDMEIVVGLIDEVEHQSQPPLTINFTADGHVGIWGSAVTGKSTFLHTIALSLALRYTPAQAVFIILDFGNNSLLPLKTLPHTADALTLEDTEALAKLERLLSKEMKQRKEILGSSRVPSIAIHNQVSGQKPIPALFIFIDNLDPVSEYDRISLENVLKDIARDGQALSIYLLFSASRSGVVRQAILGNIQRKFMFYMIDDMESSSIIGRTELPSEKIPGRGLTETDTVCSFQAALPANGLTAQERISAFQQTMENIRATWRGPLPQGVPMMPEIVPIQEFYQVPSVVAVLQAADKKVPVALDNEEIQAVAIDFNKVSHINITGTHNVGKTNLTKVILESITRKQRRFTIHIIDDNMLKLIDYQERFSSSCYLTEQTQITDLLDVLTEEVRRRKDTYIQNQKTRANKITQTPAEFYATLTPHLVIVNNVNHLLSQLSPEDQDKLGQLLEDSKLTGIHFCFVSNVQDFPQNYNKISTAIKSIDSGFTFIPLDQSQYITVSMRTAQYIPLKPGEAFYIYATRPTLVKIPLVSGRAE